MERVQLRARHQGEEEAGHGEREAVVQMEMAQVQLAQVAQAVALLLQSMPSWYWDPREQVIVRIRQCLLPILQAWSWHTNSSLVC